MSLASKLSSLVHQPSTAKDCLSDIKVYVLENSKIVLEASMFKLEFILPARPTPDLRIP